MLYQVLGTAGPFKLLLAASTKRSKNSGFGVNRIQHVTLGSGCPFWGGHSRPNRRNSTPLCRSTPPAVPLKTSRFSHRLMALVLSTDSAFSSCPYAFLVDSSRFFSGRYFFDRRLLELMLNAARQPTPLASSPIHLQRIQPAAHPAPTPASGSG